MRKISEIILHCSATPEGRNVKIEEIKRWHIKRGFSDIGYHYVIELDGTIRNGRDINLIGAHCMGHNANSIGICYVGGCDKDMNPKDTRTEAQKESLLYLIRKLMNDYNLGKDCIHCHYEYANKACPSFSRETIIKELTEGYSHYSIHTKQENVHQK